MSKSLLAIGMVISVLLLLKLVIYSGDTELMPMFERIGTSLSYSASTNVSQGEIDEVVEPIADRIKDHKSVGDTFSLLQSVADWLVFILSSLITLMSGYFGHISKLSSVQDSTEALIDKESKRSKLTKAVGVLAALIVVLNISVSKFGQEKEKSYRLAADLNTKLLTCETQLNNANTENEIRTSLSACKRIDV